ncbi:MAG: hypothetical protein ACYC8T_33600 [Myxococcaceae bacterium]
MKRPAKPIIGCPDCAALRTQLLKARQSCDDTLLQLAQEREKVNALRLSMPGVSEAPPPAYPVSTGPGAPPLRYLLVDSANTALKRYLGPVQDGVKKVAKLAVRLAGEKKP